MSLSRDEAREIAATALLLAIGLRFLSGLLQVADEFDRGWTTGTLIERFVSPVGSTSGLLVLALALLLVLSPTGSISMRINTLALGFALLTIAFGAVSVLSDLVVGGTTVGRLALSMRNGGAAFVLGGAAWWILRNFEPNR